MAGTGRLRVIVLDFAKAIHEAIGIESPRWFIALFALVGLIFFGAIGWIVDAGYRVKLREQKVQAAANIPPATAAANRQATPVPSPPTPQPRVDAEREPAPRPSINQTMTNSPGGLQVGRDLTVNMNAARRLAEGQKQVLIAEMSQSIGTNGAELITCLWGDPESTALALDFVDVFRRAGWALPGSTRCRFSAEAVPAMAVMPEVIEIPERFKPPFAPHPIFEFAGIEKCKLYGWR